MPNISPEHQLYLYKLLVREVGVGKQTMLARVEEVLDADDVMPQDVGCDSVRELLESLGGWVRLTVFKKGRVYVTLIAQPEWDALLERAEQGKEKVGGGGPKSWKRRRAGKALRPIKPKPRNRPKPEAEPEPAAESEPAAEPEPVAPTPVPAPAPEPAPEPETESAPEPEPAPTPAPESETEPSPEPTPTPQPVARVPEPPRRYPQHFASEVLCHDAELSALYGVLPLDVDPMVLLEEDWRVARSAGSFSLRDGLVRFPLRYLRSPGGEPVEVCMRRQVASPSGKQWVLVSVGDGTEELGQVGLEGLPTAEEGAWTDLLGGRAVLVSPARTFAQDIATGPWNLLLEELAACAQPEDWGADHWALREYLLVTYCRILRENKLAISEDRSHAAFDTGLLTPAGEPIYLQLSARDDDIPWSFAGFSTHSEDLSPQPASYVLSLAHVAVVDEGRIVLDRSLSREYGEGFAADVAKAVAAVRRSYRLCTPAYDPQSNTMCLLVPLATEDGAQSRALVLEVRPDGECVARAVASPRRARACARVISSELPSWLS